MQLPLSLAGAALLLAFAVAPVVVPVAAWAQPASLQQMGPQPVGRWLTQDHDGVVEITPCGDALCGRIVGMSQPFLPDGSPPRDPQGRPQCGLQILRATLTDTGRWAGKITDPGDGSAWNCAFWLDGAGRLHLRGYVLAPLLGRTQLWTRYEGAVDSACRMS
ncbi:MAG: hypothetical protein ABS99_09825 [Acetobacteraceae bacterium SCN 69-10]|nr:DUF2147 domain-containing protein [Rhodospirillales bacterium]ODU54189.1 MAG: hypothetical protein ABS99_09825 [Acetobacteraceae bacterium SCN 69-10]OJY71527.1 MAG: hypothetical protein BGP12_07125 [Rhodospirillales bacterium 70-18]